MLLEVSRVLRPVIRFSVGAEGQSTLIKFKTLAAHEERLVELIDALENYLAPNTLTVVGGERLGALFQVTIDVSGYDPKYVEGLLRNLAWHRNVQLIKIAEAEIEIEYDF